MNILMIIPPMSQPTQPLLGIPSITSCLREEGYNVIQKDLNIAAFNYFLEMRTLEKFYKTMRTTLCKKNTVSELKHDKLLSGILDKIDYVKQNIDWAKNCFRTQKNFFNISEYKDATDIILMALYIISSRFYPSILTFNKCEIGRDKNKISLFSSNEIEKLLVNKRHNIFLDFFEITIQELKTVYPDIIGISVSFADQFIPALTLTKLIKEKIKNTYIVMGGSYITAIANKIKDCKLLHRYIDSFVIYEGEIPMLSLIKSFKEGINFNKIPNLIFKENGKIYMNKIETPPDINQLPTPDFEGLPLKDYFSPFLVLPLLTSRGCYWAKCAFCMYHRGCLPGFRMRKPELVFKDLQTLASKHNCKHFYFPDEAVSPKMLKELSKKILVNNFSIEWGCEARFEKQLDGKLLHQMYRSGCRYISFGLESGSQKILDLMQKGTSISDIEKILRLCKKENIGVHLMSFFGFPGETRKDTLETIKFINRNKNFIGLLAAKANFVLVEDSIIYNNPGNYEIKKIYSPGKKEDLRILYDYETLSGLTQKEALKFSIGYTPPIELLTPFISNTHFFLYQAKYN